jgi:hypothetical protein
MACLSSGGRAATKRADSYSSSRRSPACESLLFMAESPCTRGTAARHPHPAVVPTERQVALGLLDCSDQGIQYKNWEGDAGYGRSRRGSNAGGDPQDHGLGADDQAALREQIRKKALESPAAGLRAAVDRPWPGREPGGSDRYPGAATLGRHIGTRIREPICVPLAGVPTPGYECDGTENEFDRDDLWKLAVSALFKHLTFMCG